MSIESIEEKQEQKVFNLLLSNAQVEKGLSFLKEDNDYTTNEQIELTAIEAPTFQEEQRGSLLSTET